MVNLSLDPLLLLMKSLQLQFRDLQLSFDVSNLADFLVAELVDDCVDELQRSSSGVDGLILYPIHACLHEQYQIFPWHQFLRGELSENAQDMRPAE